MTRRCNSISPLEPTYAPQHSMSFSIHIAPRTVRQQLIQLLLVLLRLSIIVLPIESWI